MPKRSLLRGCFVLAAFALVWAGCGRRSAPLGAPILPDYGSASRTVPAPTLEFRAEPENILQGQTAALIWSSTGADTGWLEPDVGRVQPSGRLEVRPDHSVSYSLTVQGPGGETTMTARVFVQPSDPLANRRPPVESEDLLPRYSALDEMVADLEDVYFAYDSSELTPEAIRTLDRNARILSGFFSQSLTGRIAVEGHCDERGSAEYNLALGDRRARAAYDFLIDAGVPAERLVKVSYGKERPQCTERNESCWRLNRRAHFAAAPY